MPRAFDNFTVDGQRYDRIGEYAHTRRDGSIVILISWQSKCTDCGEPFTCEQPGRPAPPRPVRRCKRCIALDPPPCLKRKMAIGTETPPLPPAWVLDPETGHPAPHTAPPAADSPVCAPLAPPDAAPPVRPPQRPHKGAASRRATDKPAAFTDR
jgi:hypothetical protein